MTYLKFYGNEKEKFPNQNKTHIPDKNVSKFAQKIARHFKVSLRAIRLRGYRGSAIAHCGICEIGLSHNPTVLLIIHEIGHLFTYQKLNEAKHNKNLMLFIKRACRYAEKMGYWSLEASETEKFERKKPKQFLVYSKCPNCGFVNDWVMPKEHRAFYKTHYAVNTVHDMTCSQCRVRTKHTITQQKLITFENRLAEQLERRRNFSNYALMIIPETEKALAIPETKAITVYKIPLGCV